MRQEKRNFRRGFVHRMHHDSHIEKRRETAMLTRSRGRHVWLRMPVLRESCIVVGERERGREWVSPAHNGIPRSPREHVAAPRRERIYYRVYRPRRRWTDWRTRTRGIYIALYENHTNFRMLHSNAGHYARKSPRGALLSDRLNICVCGRLWFVLSNVRNAQKFGIRWRIYT